MNSKEYFDRTAKEYDEGYDGRFVRCMYPEVVRQVKELQGEDILDIGCGNGNVIKMLEAQRPGHYYGADLSREMLKEARKRVSKEVVLKLADAVDLPFDDESFDIVICNASFHHYEEPKKAISEMNRILRPGGALILGDPTLPLFRRLFNWALKWGKAGDVWIYGKKDILPLFRSGGFDILKWKRINYRAFIFQGRKRENHEGK